MINLFSVIGCRLSIFGFKLSFFYGVTFCIISTGCSMISQGFLVKMLTSTISFRRRTLVAIGTHDLDKLQAPFTYEVDSYDFFSSCYYAYYILSFAFNLCLLFLGKLWYVYGVAWNLSLGYDRRRLICPECLWMSF